MTVDQLKTDLRNAYEAHDRDAFESALKWIGSVTPLASSLVHPVVKDPSSQWPFDLKELK